MIPISLFTKSTLLYKSRENGEKNIILLITKSIKSPDIPPFRRSAQGFQEVVAEYGFSQREEDSLT